MREKIEQLLQGELSAQDLFAECPDTPIPDEDFVFLCEKTANTSRDMASKWEQFVIQYHPQSPLHALFICIIRITNAIKTASAPQQAEHTNAIRQFLLSIKKAGALKSKALSLLSLWHRQFLDVSIFLAARVHYVAELSNPITLAYLGGHATLDILQRNLLASMLQPETLAEFINNTSEVPEDILDELHKKLDGTNPAEYRELIKSRKNMAGILFVHQINKADNDEARRNLLRFALTNAELYDWENFALYHTVLKLIPDDLSKTPDEAAQLLVAFCTNKSIAHDQELLANSVFRLCHKPDTFALFWTKLQQHDGDCLDETTLRRQLLIRAIRKSPDQLLKVVSPLSVSQKIALFYWVYQDCLAYGGQNHLDTFLKNFKQSLAQEELDPALLALFAKQIFDLEKHDIITFLKVFFSESPAPALKALPFLMALIRHAGTHTDLLTSYFWQICTASTQDLTPLFESLSNEQAYTFLTRIDVKVKPDHFSRTFLQLSTSQQTQLLQDCPPNIPPQYYQHTLDTIRPEILWKIALESSSLVCQNNRCTPAQKILFTRLAKHIHEDAYYTKAHWITHLNAGALASLFFHDPNLLQAAWSHPEASSEQSSWFALGNIFSSLGHNRPGKSFSIDILACLDITKQLSSEKLRTFFIAYQYNSDFLAAFFKCCRDMLDRSAASTQQAIQNLVTSILNLDNPDVNVPNTIALSDCKKRLEAWSTKENCQKLIDNAKKISLEAWSAKDSPISVVPVYFQDISERDFLDLPLDRQWRVFTHTHTLIDLQKNRQKLESLYKSLSSEKAESLQNFVFDDRSKLSQSQDTNAARLHFHFFCSLPQVKQKIHAGDLSTIRPALNLCTGEDALGLLTEHFDHWKTHTPENAAEILNLCLQKTQGQITTQQHIIRFAQDAHSLMRLGSSFCQLPEQTFFALSDTLVTQIKLLRSDDRRRFIESMVSLQPTEDTNVWHLLLITEELADINLPEPQLGQDTLVKNILSYFRLLFERQSRKNNTESCTSILQQLNVICRLLIDKDGNWFAKLLENDDFIWLGERWLAQTTYPQKHLHPMADFIIKHPLSHGEASTDCALFQNRAGQELLAETILNNPWVQEDRLLRLTELLDTHHAFELLKKLFALNVVSPAHESLMCFLARKLPLSILVEALYSQTHPRIAVLCLFEHPQFGTLSDNHLQRVWSTAQNWYLLSKYLSTPLSSAQKNQVTALFVRSYRAELAQNLLNHCPSGIDFAQFLTHLKANSPYADEVTYIIQNAPLHRKHIESFLGNPKPQDFSVEPDSALTQLIRTHFLRFDALMPLHPSFWDSLDEATLVQILPHLQRRMRVSSFFKGILTFCQEHKDSLKAALQTAWWWSDLDFIMLAQKNWAELNPATRKDLSNKGISQDKPWVFLGTMQNPQKALEDAAPILATHLPGVSLDLLDAIQSRKAMAKEVLSNTALEFFAWDGSLNFCHKIKKLPQDFPLEKLIATEQQHWQTQNPLYISQWRAIFQSYTKCLNAPQHMHWFIVEFLPNRVHDNTAISWLEPSLLPRLDVSLVQKNVVELSERLWSTPYDQAVQVLGQCKNIHDVTKLPTAALTCLIRLCESLNLYHYAKIFQAIDLHQALCTKNKEQPPLFVFDNIKLLEEFTTSCPQKISEARTMARAALREIQRWFLMPCSSNQTVTTRQFEYFCALTPDLLETETFVNVFTAYLQYDTQLSNNVFELLLRYKENHPEKYDALWRTLTPELKESLAKLICRFDRNLVFQRNLLTHFKPATLAGLCAQPLSDPKDSAIRWELRAQQHMWERIADGSTTEPGTLRALGLMTLLYKHIAALRQGRAQDGSDPLLQNFYLAITAQELKPKSNPLIGKNNDDDILFFILRLYLRTFKKDDLCKTSMQWFLKLEKPALSKAFQTLWHYLKQEGVLREFLMLFQMEKPTPEQANWILQNLPDDRPEYREMLFLSMPISFCLKQQSHRVEIRYLRAKLYQLQQNLDRQTNTPGFKQKAHEIGAEVLEALAQIELSIDTYQQLAEETRNAPLLQGVLLAHIFHNKTKNGIAAQQELLDAFGLITTPWDIRAIPEAFLQDLRLPAKLTLLCNPISCLNLPPDTVSGWLHTTEVLNLTLKFWLNRLTDFPQLGRLLLILNPAQLSKALKQFADKRGTIFHALYEAMPFWSMSNIDVWLEHIHTHLPTDQQLSKLLYYYQSSKNVAVRKVLFDIIPKLSYDSIHDTPCLIALYEFYRDNLSNLENRDKYTALATACIEKAASLGQFDTFIKKPGLLKTLFLQHAFNERAHNRPLPLSQVFFENMSTAYTDSLFQMCHAFLEFPRDAEMLASQLQNPRVPRQIKDVLSQAIASFPKSSEAALVQVANYDHTKLFEYCPDAQLEAFLPNIINRADNLRVRQALEQYHYEWRGHQYIEQIHGFFKTLRQWFWRCWYFGFTGFFKPKQPILYNPNAIKPDSAQLAFRESPANTPWEWLLEPRMEHHRRPTLPELRDALCKLEGNHTVLSSEEHMKRINEDYEHLQRLEESSPTIKKWLPEYRHFFELNQRRLAVYYLTHNKGVVVDKFKIAWSIGSWLKDELTPKSGSNTYRLFSTAPRDMQNGFLNLVQATGITKPN